MLSINEKIILRKLNIKTFNIEKVLLDKKTYIYKNVLYIRKNLKYEILDSQNNIKDITIKIIEPNNHNIFVNSIMDFIPIATKVEGNLGEGITHVITGAIVMLTGCDETNTACGKFGWSSGILKHMVFLNRSGTPSINDIILNICVKLKSAEGISRSGPNSAYIACDKILQEIRGNLKTIDGNLCDESYDFFDKIKPNKKKVIIVKQIAGQGSMYDNQLFPNEPCGFIGGKSIIDMGNMPAILSPNQFRDGALRSMT